MMNLDKNLKCKALLICLALSFLSLNAYAFNSVGMVGKVNGKAFYKHNGAMHELKEGFHFNNNTEVITEVGGQVTIMDFSDHKFHLGESGNVKFKGGQIVLEKGYLWVQSFNENAAYEIITANSVVKYKKGEFIVSFDNLSGKTQSLCIAGKITLANLLENDLAVNISAGKFSFIDKEYNQGVPRSATPVGYGSYKKITSIFQGVKPLTKNQRLGDRQEVVDAQKVIASIEDESPMNFSDKKVPTKISKKKGKILFLKSNFKSKKSYRSIASVRKENSIPIRIHGISKNPPQRSGSIKILKGKKIGKKKAIKKHSSVSRAPSSVKMGHAHIINEATPVSDANVNEGNFEKSLLKYYKKQTRHAGEVNQLIDQLKSFDQDYQKDY